MNPIRVVFSKVDLEVATVLHALDNAVAGCAVGFAPWIMPVIYTMTFGSFIGLSFAVGLLIDVLFDQLIPSRAPEIIDQLQILQPQRKVFERGESA